MTYDDWKTTDTSEDIAGPRQPREDDEVADLYQQISKLAERLRLANEEIGGLRWELAEAKKRELAEAKKKR